MAEVASISFLHIRKCYKICKISFDSSIFVDQLKGVFCNLWEKFVLDTD